MKRILFLGLFTAFAVSAAELQDSALPRKRALDMGSLSQDGRVAKAPALLLLAAAIDTIELSQKPSNMTEDLFSCIYENCYYKAKNKDAILGHLASKHSENDYLYRCPYCKDEYNARSKRAFKQHCYKYHRDITNFSDYANSVYKKLCKRYNDELKQPKKRNNIVVKSIYNPDTKLHMCIQCGFQNPRKDRVKEHIHTVHEDGKFECPGCHILFGRSDSVETHVRIGHCKAGLQKVRIKGFEVIPVDTDSNLDEEEVVFDTAGPADNNIPEDSGSETEEFEDELMIIDDESDIDPARSAENLQPATIVSDERVETLSRPEINESQDELVLVEQDPRQYMQKLEAAKFICTYEGCNKEFYRPNNTLAHIRGVHLKQFKFHCHAPGCDFATSNSNSLSEHTQPRHEAPKKLICSVEGCNKSFVSKFDFDNHMREHRGEYLYCDHPGCDYKVFDSCSLQSHMDRKHKEANFKCDHPNCESKFHTKSDLARHKKCHLPMAERKLGCTQQECNHRFNSKKKLNL